MTLIEQCHQLGLHNVTGQSACLLSALKGADAQASRGHRPIIGSAAMQEVIAESAALQGQQYSWQTEELEAKC